MTISRIPVVVQGTGNDGRAAIIRSHCKEGASVQMRRARQSAFSEGATRPGEDEALEVWLQCNSLLGLRRSWKKIGYVEGSRYGMLATQMATGRLRVRKSVINSFFAPLDREEPQVALQIEVDWSGDAEAQTPARF